MNPPHDQDQARELLLDSLAGIEFDLRYYALCDVDAGESGPTPTTRGQEAGLRAAGFDCRYDPAEDFFACTRPGDPAVPGVDLAVNVVIRFAAVELVFVLTTPVGLIGPTAHGVARTLWQRADRPERRPPYPRVPFGSRRPYEQTVVGIAELIRAVGAAVGSVRWS